MFAVIEIIALLLLLLKLVVGLLTLVFWLWMLVHAATNNGLGTGEKIAWVLIVLCLPCLGALLYFFIGRPKGTSAAG